MIVIDAPKWRMLILCLISLISVWIAFRPILRVAKSKNITDCPDHRKLQKVPIPVLGGAAVFFGIVVGISFFKTMFKYPSIFPIITAMTALLYVGVIDDVLSIKPWKRILLEAGAALLVIYGNRYYICDFGGLWGIGEIPLAIGIILSAITFVGVVNAINMIDGVDGLCSGFCILVCTAFGLLFFFAYDYSFAALAAVSVGALVPFFVHNVVGLKSKMFLGDGGTMVMGTLMASMVFELLSKNFSNNLQLTTLTTLGVPLDFSLIAFSLAVLSIPIFDTLRVMIERMLRGVSPFSPDKTHLHHLFTEVGFSYIGTTFRELGLNVLVIASFVLSWLCGAPVDVQLYVVIAVSLFATLGTATYLRWVKKSHDSFFARRTAAHGRRSHIERKGVWLKIQKMIDEH